MSMERIIFHIDVNNAFLSWTALDLLRQGYQYDIRESYAAIGGDEKSRRGIVLAKSPKAKKCGVTTGETLYIARKKCPAIRFYPPNYEWYQYNSKALFQLLSHYSPDIEVASIDECYLDYGKVKNLYGDEYEFAKKIQKEIFDTLGFTVNIGIANSKLCAKMASDFSKPYKIHTLYNWEIKEKLFPLPVDDLFGIGKQTSAKLHRLNIHTISDLAHANPVELSKYFKNSATKMIEWANGIDDSEVISEETERKGISNTTTLPKDMSRTEEIFPILQAISENVSTSLRKKEKYASVIAVIFKDKFFKSYTHQRKLENPTCSTSVIFEVSKELFLEGWKREPIRLIGIRLDQLTDHVTYQSSLFEDFEEKKEQETLDFVVDEIKKKFGDQAIGKASLTGNQIKRKFD